VSMTDNQTPVTWLTQEAFDRLKGQLDALIAARPDIAAEINARREEGDLRENGGYHAAKEEQGKQEARIRQLEDLLRNARVGQAPMKNGVAGPGMVVTVRFEDEDETESFLIGSREEAGGDLEVYSAQSPLGKALTGVKEGKSCAYDTPTGKTMRVTVLSAAPYKA
jgi:transcription elongation factor GreA